MQRAILCGGAGDLDSAFEHLDRALDGHDPALVHLAVAPQWDSLRVDPRFNQRLTRMGLRPHSVIRIKPTRLPNRSAITSRCNERDGGRIARPWLGRDSARHAVQREDHDDRTAAVLHGPEPRRASGGDGNEPPAAGLVDDAGADRSAGVEPVPHLPVAASNATRSPVSSPAKIRLPAVAVTAPMTGRGERYFHLHRAGHRIDGGDPSL